DVRIQAISNAGTDSWSGAGGLMILQSVPDIVVEADPSTYPSHWMIDATNGHGPEDKGGGQQQSRENELLDLGTGTPIQPPYWLRMVRIGNCLWRSEEHTSELQSRGHLVCRLLLEKKKKKEQ